MLDATKALWYCGVGTCLVLAVVGIVFSFTMPEVSFWIGLYEGLAFWILFGMASGFLLVGLVKAEGCKKEAEFNSPDEDAVPPPDDRLLPGVMRYTLRFTLRKNLPSAHSMFMEPSSAPVGRNRSSTPSIAGHSRGKMCVWMSILKEDIARGALQRQARSTQVQVRSVTKKILSSIDC